MNVEVRLARKEDAKDICRVHAYSWYTTYQGLIPDEILDDKINHYEKRIPMMEKRTKSGDLFVITLHERVIGMLDLGLSRDSNYVSCGEIYAIYLLKEYQGNGYGKKLFLFGINELVNRGFSNMILNVLEGNKTISFYEKFGGRQIGVKEDEFQNIVLKEKIMYFENIKEI